MEIDIQILALNYLSSRTDKDFSLLYNRLKPGLADYAYKFIRDYEEALELVQIVFTKIYANIDTYDPQQGKFSTYIYKYMYHECLTYMNNKRSAPVQIDEFPEWDIKDDNDPYDENKKYLNKYNEDFWDCVLQQIDNLPEFAKQIFLDAYFFKIPYKDLAVKYDIPLNTVRTRVFNAKKKVHENTLKCLAGEVINRRKPRTDEDRFNKSRKGRELANNISLTK